MELLSARRRFGPLVEFVQGDGRVTLHPGNRAAEFFDQDGEAFVQLASVTKPLGCGDTDDRRFVFGQLQQPLGRQWLDALDDSPAVYVAARGLQRLHRGVGLQRGRPDTNGGFVRDGGFQFVERDGLLTNVADKSVQAFDPLDAARRVEDVLAFAELALAFHYDRFWGATPDREFRSVSRG